MPKPRPSLINWPTRKMPCCALGWAGFGHKPTPAERLILKARLTTTYRLRSSEGTGDSCFELSLRKPPSSAKRMELLSTRRLGEDSGAYERLAPSAQRWHARAEAELGEIAFLNGDVDKATRLLKSSLISLYGRAGPGSGYLLHLQSVGNGLVELLSDGQTAGDIDQPVIRFHSPAAPRPVK